MRHTKTALLCCLAASITSCDKALDEALPEVVSPEITAVTAPAASDKAADTSAEPNTPTPSEAGEQAPSALPPAPPSMTPPPAPTGAPPQVPPPSGARPPGRGLAQILSDRDTNGDGKLEESEAGKMWGFLSRADSDKDGFITEDELHNMPPPPGAPPTGGPNSSRAGGPSPQAMISTLDKNEDGKVGSDEVPAEMWDRLKRADSDKDGFVTAEEISTVVPPAPPRSAPVRIPFRPAE